MPSRKIQSFRVFVATWNVGGKSPDYSLNLDQFLHIQNQPDIYVLGFQEIVPLNAGNVLVAEDNEPAAKWLALIDQSLNRSSPLTSPKTTEPFKTCSSLFQKPSLKIICKNFRTGSVRKLKTCNCNNNNNNVLERKNSKDFCLWCPPANLSEDDELIPLEVDNEDDEGGNYGGSSGIDQQKKYSLIVGKQMVGIFLTVWVKTELVQFVSHLRVSYVSRGIMGYLGNKGCISVSMCLHETSFCFICSHLASGEKEGDELRRNFDVIEILKNTQFHRTCRSPSTRIPEKIIEHDRVIWLGDLNYRIALSYSDTRKIVERNDWNALYHKDQLKIERDAGRVLNGWKEGKIYFAPTYKYSYNSDIYAGATTESKNKRRSPAWYDRILWHGNGINQLSYVRWESQFSDHRPVCSTFLVDVLITEDDGLKN